MNFTLDENYKSPLMLAVGLHLILIILLIVHFKFSSEQPVTQSSNNIIQAVAVSDNQAHTPIQQSTPKPVVQTPKPVVKPIPPPPSQQQAIKQPPPVAVKQPPTPPQPTQQQLAIEQQAQAELALQKAQALAQKKAAQQAALKLVQQQAASALNQQLQAQAQQQKQATQKQQMQSAQQATQQLLQQELSAATPTTSTANATNTISAADQGQIDKYKALIIASISQQWIVPDIKNKNESCKILVHLAPGGVVLSVTITQSSGDDVLDSSAVTAINKASPLPVPKDSTLFNNFRDINLTVQPQGILADSN